MRQISDEDRREIAKELREQFYCCRYAEEFTEGLYDVFSPVHYELNRGCYPDLATCPSCGMSNSIAWGHMMATSQKEAVAMLADSWNSR